MHPDIDVDVDCFKLARVHCRPYILEMLEGVPFSEVPEFIKKQRAGGRYKASSARNMLVAAAIVQELLEPGKDSVAYVQEHVADLFVRHQNLNPGVGHNSLIAYRSRLSRALKDFVAHRTGKKATPSRTVEKTRPRALAQTEERDVAREALLHRFPLRPGFDVQILLPRDFSEREAKRITQWILSFAENENE